MLKDIKPVAVLYQAQAASAAHGIRKPMKEGGYADSGADIIYNLQQAGIPVITPTKFPDPTCDTNWVFPDTEEGIHNAISLGAQVLWANTVLFEGHPLEGFAGQGLYIVGQPAQLTQKYDDKWVTNELLKQKGLQIAPHMLVDMPNLPELSEERLYQQGISFPAVIKPVRGRGSQGVVQVSTLAELKEKMQYYLQQTEEVNGKRYNKYGTSYIVESYMQGKEVTVTVMPPGIYQIDGAQQFFDEHWSLPLVERFNHSEGIAPYSGVIAVSRNSRVIKQVALTPQQQLVMQQCAKAGGIIGSKAPIRIDCRADEKGDYKLFDLNMKPNMTGAGRPKRGAQNSLTVIAAVGVDWSYQSLLENILNQTWEF